ncbi:MAG: 1-deoxy-D-xylulose-5-phosphate reductoisomerase, partial [Oscillospiraceae bacterium]
MSKAITLLGSTGSIGTQSLDVIKKQGYTVFALAAYSNTALLMRQIDEFSPKFVAMVDDNAANELSAQLNKMQNPPQLLRGEDGVAQLAGMKEADIVLNAVVGIAGLKATLTALNKGIDVALANKESLVTGGNLVIDAAQKSGAKLLPVDSEHSAIFQCLQDKF